MKTKLTAQVIESFAGAYLSKRYDNPRPTPHFHRQCWHLYCSPLKQAGAIAPRDHAKSTALTFDFIMASVCFRAAKYVILIGSTEDKASEQLSNISEELHENAELRADFGIAKFETDQKTEIIVVFDDGARFRILARGAEQKIRGAMWDGRRPDLIVCDDMEDDEQVENKDRRMKFRRWFFRAAKQALSKSGRIRVHGTVLHEDALLPRLMRNKVWTMLFFKAHKSYDDFSDILWPERWTEADLREKRLEFEEEDDAAGYSQEFLNTPQDNNKAYLKKSQFLGMLEEDYNIHKMYYAGVDFAFSKKTTANHSAFVVGGVDVRNLVHHVDVIREHLDTVEIVDTFFELQAKWNIEMFYVPSGKDWLSVEPVLKREMMKRNIWLIIEPVSDSSDKAIKGQIYRKKHNAGACRYDKDSDWYNAYEQEVQAFNGITDAKTDDQFDAAATLHRGIEMGVEVEEEDFMEDEDYEFELGSRNARGAERSATGY